MSNIWRHKGIEAKAKPFDPELVDSQSGACIILGCSRDVWADFDEALALFKNNDDYHVMAINDIAHQIRKPINHIVSTHKELPGPLRQIRRVKMLEDVATHSIKEYPGVDHVWGAIAGNSGMFALKIALLMGYEKIIVCGIACDGTGHYYDPVDHMGNGSGTFDERHQRIWHELHRDSPEARNNVRVMSGQFKQLYGKADHGWIWQEKGHEEEIKRNEEKFQAQE